MPRIVAVVAVVAVALVGACAPGSRPTTQEAPPVVATVTLEPIVEVTVPAGAAAGTP